jgi:protein-disulfide isomerase
MKSTSVWTGAGAALLLCGGSIRAETGSGTLSREAVEQIVHEYIVQHPDVIVESARAWQDRERKAREERAHDAILANRRELLSDADSPQAGKADASLAVVQFFDYNCGYCRRVSPVIDQLLRDNSQLRVIFKEFPILGPESEFAARAALAAQKQGKYMEFHRELMGLSSKATPTAVEETARKAGLNIDRLLADMKSAEIQGVLDRNRQLGSTIGVQATPSFVIGNELVSGALDPARLRTLIARAAESGSAAGPH